jgi:hypothetical protein
MLARSRIIFFPTFTRVAMDPSGSLACASN